MKTTLTVMFNDDIDQTCCGTHDDNKNQTERYDYDIIRREELKKLRHQAVISALKGKQPLPDLSKLNLQ